MTSCTVVAELPVQQNLGSCPIGSREASSVYAWKLAQSCPTLCNPLDCSLPGSSVYEILQAGILEWVAIPFSRESSRPKDQTGSPVLVAFLYHLSHQGFHSYLLHIPQSTVWVKQSRKKWYQRRGYLWPGNIHNISYKLRENCRVSPYLPGRFLCDTGHFTQLLCSGY